MILRLCFLALLIFGQSKPGGRAAEEHKPEIRTMADYRWISTTGDLNSANSYSPVVRPGINDSIYFDGSSDKSVISNLSGFGGETKTRVWFQEEYDGDIGASDSPLIAPIKYLIHHGTGTLYHEFQWDSVNDTQVVIESPNQELAYRLDGALNNTLDVYLVNGRCEIGGSGQMRSLTVGSRFGVGQPVVEVELGTGVVGNYRQASGVVTSASSFTAGGGIPIIDGGTLIYDALGTDAWANLYIAGGTVIYNGSGALSSCIISSGTLDMTQDSRAKTITKLILMPGCEFLTHANITVGKRIDLRDKVPVLPVLP